MKDIELVSEKKFSSTGEELNEKLEKIIQDYENASNYYNTLGSLTWILRGAIEYFDKLDSQFLGDDNDSGIPSKEADHFANIFYRLINAIDYLKRLWKIDISKTEQIKRLIDIRTLIIHSGEQLNNIELLELEGYKDSQLWRIFHKENHNAFGRFHELPEMDYCIVIANDKHDKNKQRYSSEVDYDAKNESFYDLSIYLNAADVRNIVLLYIEDFLDNALETKPQKETPKLPSIKNRVINKENQTIDFDKLAKLISKDLRSGYVIENDIEHWHGYGLKRLYEYIQGSSNISDEVREVIQERIQDVTSKYWDDYENKNVPDYELTELDITSVFLDYTPHYHDKCYLEGQKLFYKIAPFFNTGNRNDVTDIDYLAKFINAANEALNISLDLEQNVDQLICDYIVQSIQVKISNETNDMK